MEHQLTVKQAAQLITAGKAILTFRNTKSQNRYTFKIQKAKNAELFFISVLTGSDNTSDYTYIGILTETGFKLTAKSKMNAELIPVKTFNVVYNLITKHVTHPDLEIYHAGHCCRCGRLLTTPESITAGIGPECIKLSKKF